MSASTPSMEAVPPAWRDNHPWGPQANALREQGRLPVCVDNAQTRCWEEFGRQHLQEGDLILRRGADNRLADKFVTRVLYFSNDSPFSHDGIVHQKDGKFWVHDADVEGMRDLPFEIWMLDVVPGYLGIRRLRPEYRDRIPQILAFIEDKYQRDVPFDNDLNLDDEKLYCSELIEKAFRSAGLKISEPVPIRCLPQYHRFAWLRPLGERVTGIRVDEPIFTLGNLCYGACGSPIFEWVYQGEHADLLDHQKPPTCPAVPYP
jgi:hypothetical protein